LKVISQPLYRQVIKFLVENRTLLEWSGTVARVPETYPWAHLLKKCLRRPWGIPGKLVSNEAHRLGLIVRPIVNLNMMSPSFICTEQDIDFIVDTLRQTIEVTSDKLRSQGVW
jgi:hypothetical protein